MNAFDPLFEEYVADLRTALGAAREWWKKLQAGTEAESASKREAAQTLEARWPFGPSSHPFVLAVYRKYFLAVQAINDQIEAGGAAHDDGQPTEDDWGADDAEDETLFADNTPIAPPLFLIDALHGEHDDLVDALVWLVYQPVGMSADERAI